MPISVPGTHAERTISIDDVSSQRVIPIHVQRGDLTLGIDEYIENSRYSFLPHHDTARTNYSRPLVDHSAKFENLFHSAGGPSRWFFRNEGDFILYRHDAGPLQENGTYQIHLVEFPHQLVSIANL